METTERRSLENSTCIPPGWEFRLGYGSKLGSQGTALVPFGRVQLWVHIFDPQPLGCKVPRKMVGFMVSFEGPYTERLAMWQLSWNALEDSCPHLGQNCFQLLATRLLRAVSKIIKTSLG